MALYQRGRIWQADYYVRGNRVQESTGTSNRREAEKFLALRISEIERGVTRSPLKQRFLSSAKSTWSTQKRTSDPGNAMSKFWST